jgi:hypothetical protein
MTDPKAQETLQAALTFLQSTEAKSFADMRRHTEDVGMYVDDTSPYVVNATYALLELQQRQLYIAAAWKELGQPEPDLRELIHLMSLALSFATSVSAEIRTEIDRLKEEIATRELRSETYDRMLELAAAVEETLPHIAVKKNNMDAVTAVAALKSGNLDYIAATLRLVQRLRTDTGKNGPDSQTALQTLADRIAGLAEQLQANVH